MSATTQEVFPVEEIKEGVVISRAGTVSMIIQTSAVNFDLLSENEQLAIIGSFAGLLNSLSFSIQIVIRSKRLDITNYLHSLVKAEQEQDNPLLKKLMQDYRNFVATIIRENEVLDKQFYIVISVSSIELGVVKNNDKNLQKAITLLIPRRDHVIRQLNRIGLKSTQLDDEALINLFYDIYNEQIDEKPAQQQAQPEETQAGVATPSAEITPQPASPVAPTTPAPIPQQLPASQPAPPPIVQPQQSWSVTQMGTATSPYPQTTTIPLITPTRPPVQQQPIRQPVQRSGPFVVEELPDEFHTP